MREQSVSSHLLTVQVLANTQLLFRAHCEMVPQNDSKTIQIHGNSLTEVEALQDCCLRLMIVNESYPFGRIHDVDSMETYTKLLATVKLRPRQWNLRHILLVQSRLDWSA